jgi:transcriptional regulator with XRE-family HTH domain
MLFFAYCFQVPVDRLPELICSKVAELLREERQKQSISINALSQKAGISRQSISYVEQEKRIPTLYTLLRITLVLGVDLEKIIARARKRAFTQME